MKKDIKNKKLSIIYFINGKDFFKSWKIMKDIFNKLIYDLYGSFGYIKQIKINFIWKWTVVL